MSRKSGRVKRVVSRLFKERQIYHRSDGVVHFISMSTNTQIALTAIAAAALLWISYASVNVVFKEQIIVEKERKARLMAQNYSREMLQQQQAYADIDTLNTIMRQHFDAEIDSIRNRHQTLRKIFEGSLTVESGLNGLADVLNAAGAPNGQKPSNANRHMINKTPSEVTPRRSRTSMLRKQALIDSSLGGPSNIPATAPSSEVLAEVDDATRDLYVEQMLLIADLEEKANATAKRARSIIQTLGLGLDAFVEPSKIRNVGLPQGGPFISADNLANSESAFFKRANLTSAAIYESEVWTQVLKSVPLSSPLLVRRRFTSGFGVRRDPITKQRSNHFGIDFAAPWRSPVVATADGVVSFAGRRSGFGRVVEITHAGGFKTRYAHLHRISVKKGRKVSLHDKIGELGSSGRSTGPHVHYEILFKGRQRNPQRFIEAGRYVFES
ncbi:MAG: M23 family metallopeptidase [Pseudomonadota bacterium]